MTLRNVLLLIPLLFCACASAGAERPMPLAPETEPVSADLTLVTWNIAKNDTGNAEIDHLLAVYAPDILCLQEATSDTCARFGGAFENCRFSPSWNMRDDRSTGVVTASRYDLRSTRHFKSPGREFFLFTPKASMIVTIDLPNGEALMVINVHALNFVPGGTLHHQLEALHDAARDHKGPIIACGDFNTWDSRRLKTVQQFAARLGMVEALAYHESGGTPSRWAALIDPFIEIDLDAPLDRVFCRGVEVAACTRLSGFASSDHTPLVLKLRYIR